MNKENYKNAINQIHAKKDLKDRTLEKIKQKGTNKKILYIRFLAACATIVLVFSGGLFYWKNWKELIIVNPIKETKIATTENDLPRFENIEQLKNVLEENHKKEIDTKDLISEDSVTSSYESSETSKADTSDYSTTNIQVENVDEADVVKTDGEYIYYIANQKIYIVKASELKVVAEIKIKEDNEKFYPKEIYINKNRLIILGNSKEYIEYKNKDGDSLVLEEIYRISSHYMSKALVYDISNKEDIKQIREIGLDGNYIQSRMIGENVYFISTKSLNYYKEISDNEILPMVKDTSSSDETKKIECTDIVYFEGTNSYRYMIVAGFNIYNNNEVNTETFFGASDTIYASEENLYITQSIYKDGYFSKGTENIIYKFNMKESQIQLQCKGKIDGYLNNQFSMDEYEGNLRIATTSGYDEKSSNQLYILDENLKEIGKIENLAKGEKIYSVRFIGKVGYIVTFKQIDPLFVIDLSNPTNPMVKGELKIPGYSSYLHPYDENHIIGIGYNTKTSKYGAITNSNMKMSMFDVSDLENPKEMFSIDIGEEKSYSEITSNHKALFYNKDRNLIGFPVTYRNSGVSENGLVIYKINLENGFEMYGEIKQKINYKTNIDRAIYIGDKLYTLSDRQIISYDLNTVEKINEIELY